MIIAVDFDGTLVDHRFPDIGREVPAAFEWLKLCQQAGARLILWTVRADGGEGGPSDSPLGDYLRHAVEFCQARGIEFWAVNENPEQASWSTSPKAYAHIYIDDAAYGCPLRENPRMGGRPYVDWRIVGPSVLAKIQRGAS